MNDILFYCIHLSFIVIMQTPHVRVCCIIYYQSLPQHHKSNAPFSDQSVSSVHYYYTGMMQCACHGAAAAISREHASFDPQCLVSNVWRHLLLFCVRVVSARVRYRNNTSYRVYIENVILIKVILHGRETTEMMMTTMMMMVICNPEHAFAG